MTCEACGHELVIGDWPYCPHGKSVQTSPFKAIFDYGLGREVTGLGDRHQAMRANKLDYRDHPPKGELSARIDRIEQQKRLRHG